MPSIFRPGWARRLQSLHDYCALHKLHGVVVSNPLNIRYLTGFQGSSGLLICSADSACLVTDGRYDAAVRGSIAAGEMADIDVERVALRYDLTLVEVIRRRKFSRVGFEAGHVTVAALESWRRAATETETDAIEIDWVATDGVVEGLRIIKDAEEIALFRRAGPALAGVTARLREWVRAGRTEREVARDIDGGISLAGFSDVAFPTIVASGPHSAHPHARPTDRRLQDGDLVVLDFGGVLDGYCVDLTRMAGIGQVGSKAMALVTAVLSAQREAIAAVRPGRLGADVDKAARSVLEAAGLGSAFLHGTGHGLGLEVHEAPRVSRSATGSSDTLQPGMVCTIEPGAYVEGLGGVRMEDDVLVTASGCEVLTEAPRDLLVV